MRRFLVPAIVHSKYSKIFACLIVILLVGWFWAQYRQAHTQQIQKSTYSSACESVTKKHATMCGSVAGACGDVRDSTMSVQMHQDGCGIWHCDSKKHIDGQCSYIDPQDRIGQVRASASCSGGAITVTTTWITNYAASHHEFAQWVQMEGKTPVTTTVSIKVEDKYHYSYTFMNPATPGKHVYALQMIDNTSHLASIRTNVTAQCQ